MTILDEKALRETGEMIARIYPWMGVDTEIATEIARTILKDYLSSVVGDVIDVAAKAICDEARIKDAARQKFLARLFNEELPDASEAREFPINAFREEAKAALSAAYPVLVGEIIRLRQELGRES